MRAGEEGHRHALDVTEHLAAQVEDEVLAQLRRLLPGEEADEFVAAYAASLREAYPPEEDGSTLFPFRRIFIVVSGL